MIARRTIFSLAIGGFFAAGVMLRDAAAADATAPIAALNDGLISSMRDGQATPFQQRYARLMPLVDRAFDLKAILQASVGARWASLPPDQQARLLALFRQFTVASWVSNFSAYDGEMFELSPTTRASGAEQVVQTRLVPTRGEAIRIDYVMRSAPDGWRAVDVLLDGSISRVAVQRSDFRRLLDAGDASALIASLQKKVSDLSGGALPA